MLIECVQFNKHLSYSLVPALKQYGPDFDPEVDGGTKMAFYVIE